MLKTDPALASIPVVMVSIVDDTRLGIALGATEYLTKPVDRDLLKTVIHRLADPQEGPLILVVEDDDLSRELVCGVARESGGRVEEAVNGRQALQFMEKETPDLVLLDLMMPEVDGFSVIEQMQRDPILKKVPVVVITARDPSDHDLRGLRREVSQILRKGNYGRKDLLEIIGNLIRPG